MDASSRTTNRDGRILLTLALMVLAGTTGAAFGMLFDGRAPSARLVLAAGAAVLVGALLERRHLALSLLAAVLGLLVSVGLVAFPRTMTFGLPTVETVEALARALGRVGRHAVEQTTPAQPLPSLFSASLMAVWAASYASHALAVRAGSAILALIPQAGLLAFTGVVLEEGAHPAYAGVFLAAAIAVLFTAGIRDLRVWGPVLPRRSRQSLGMAAGAIGRRARGLGLAAVAGAVLLPGVLPGFGSEAVIDVHGRGNRVAISPLVDIRPNLQRKQPVELFTVEAERPSYWRLFALERFTGRMWVSDDAEDESQDVVVEGRRPLPGDPLSRSGRLLRQEFAITGLGGENLPTAFAPVGTDVPVPVGYDSTLGTLTVPGGIPSGGFRYSVTSDVVAPIPEELDRDFDFSSVPDRYMRVPSSLPPRVERFAREISSGGRSPYRKALAIQNYFRNFTYDDEFRAGHGVDDLLYFLEARRGYCEQFSAAMAVFLRTLGYPARVAVGFTPGIQDPSGRYRVTTDEAHAWTEMYFPGYGWLAFEPTPSRDNPAGASYQNLPIARGGFAPPVGEVAQVQHGGPTGLQSARLDFVERRLAGGGASVEPDAADGPERLGWLPPILGAAMLALLLLAGMPAVKAVRRRRLLRRARTPGERVLAAFDVFERGAADLGLGRREGETLNEYRCRLHGAVRFSDGRLERLAGLAAVTLYSRRDPDGGDAERALADARAMAADVRKEVGRIRVLAGALRPYPPEDARVN